MSARLPPATSTPEGVSATGKSEALF